MKTLEQLQQDWGNSICGKEPEQYIYDYMENHMQAYADQKVNRVLSEAITKVKKIAGDNITISVILSEIESLKIKQP